MRNVQRYESENVNTCHTAMHDDHESPSEKDLLRKMILIRAFEHEVQRQVDKGNIKGTTHVCIGQEAVAVGACVPLIEGDRVTSTHRGHGHFLACGGDPRLVMAELFGRDNGYCRGKGGTQHMASIDLGFVGSNGITGGGIPYATGMALGMKLKQTQNVVLCFFGDGAINQGTFHESLNIASLWDLPIIYLCENNQYAMGTRIQDNARLDRLSDRAVAYGISGITVDGNDVTEMTRTLVEVTEDIRRQPRPVLVEAITYRVAGHSRNDKCHYRTREEEAEWRASCPIARLKEKLFRKMALTEAEQNSIDSETQRLVEESVEFAMNGGFLDRSELFAGQFAD